MSLQTRLSDLITAIGGDIKRRHGVATTTTAATFTPDATKMQFNFTAQASTPMQFTGSAGMIAAMVDGQSIIFRIKDNGTPAAIQFNPTYYRAVGVTLPTTTVANKTVYIGGKFNADAQKIDLIAVAQEA